MNILEIILAVISVLSFALAVFSFFSSELRKVNERANVTVMKEQLKNIDKNLSAILHTTDAIIQIPKQRDINVSELQDIGRIARGQIYLLKTSIKNYGQKLEEWKFGKLIKSTDLTPEILNQVEKDKKR